MVRPLDPDEVRRLFPPLVGKDIPTYNVEYLALQVLRGTDDPPELRIGVSVTFARTQPEDAPDVVFALTLDQAHGMLESMTDLLDQVARHAES